MLEIQGKYDLSYKTTNAGGDIALVVTPAALNSPTIEAEYNNESYTKYINNKQVKSGELCIVASEEMLGNGFYVDDETGELFVCGENANNYSIPDPAEGELVYTFR